jgi:hypothetical protein
VSDQDGQKAFFQKVDWFKYNSFLLNTFFSAQLLSRELNSITRVSLIWDNNKINAGLLLLNKKRENAL